jgi:hypothetical protein
MWGSCANLDPKMKQMHNKRLAKNVLNLNRECIRLTCWHVDIFRFCCLIHLRYILQIPLKWSVILLKSRTLTGYFTTSTASSATNCQLSPDVVSDECEIIGSWGIRVSRRFRLFVGEVCLMMVDLQSLFLLTLLAW